MPILMPHFKLAYFPVPKIACTSIKHVAFEINNGFFLKKIHKDAKPGGKKCSIHAIYKSEEFSEKRFSRVQDMTTFAIIRDPIERVLSAYSNRVLHHRALKHEWVTWELQRLGLSDKPDINEFVLALEGYREASKQIMSHTRPLSYFLGDDLSRYDRIFTIRQMPALADFLAERIGRPVEIPRMQTGGRKQKLESLTDEAFESLLRFCEPDYELIKDYLPIPVKQEAVA